MCSKFRPNGREHFFCFLVCYSRYVIGHTRPPPPLALTFFLSGATGDFFRFLFVASPPLTYCLSEHLFVSSIPLGPHGPSDNVPDAIPPFFFR